MEIDLLKKFYLNNIKMWNPNTNYLTYLNHFGKILKYCIDNKKYILNYNEWLDILNTGNLGSKIGSETHNICHSLNIIESDYEYGNNLDNNVYIEIPRDIIYQYLIDNCTYSQKFWDIVIKRYFDFLNTHNIFNLKHSSHIQSVCLNIFVCYLIDSGKQKISELKNYINFAKSTDVDLENKILKVYQYDICKPGFNILEKLNISSNGKELPYGNLFLKSILQSLEDKSLNNKDVNSNVIRFKNFYFNNLDKLKKELQDSNNIKLREEFLIEYPLDRIKTLTLKEYCLGSDMFKESFSYKLEFGKYKNVGFGIGGGSAGKHGIYLGLNNSYYNYKNEIIIDIEEYWNRFKGQLYNFLLEIKETDRLPNFKEKYNLIETCPLLLTKLCFLYYPEKFVNLGSKSKLTKLISLFELDISKEEASPFISYKISEYLKYNINILNLGDPELIGKALWEFLLIDENINKYTKENFLNEVYIDSEKYDSIVSVLEKN